MLQTQSDGSGFISKTSFEEACRALARCSSSNPSHVSVETSRDGDQLYLRVIRPLKNNSHPPMQKDATELFSAVRDSHNLYEPSDTQEDDDGDDGDDVAIYHPVPFQTIASVEYHIVFSTSYRVPVLYFFVHNDSPSLLPSIDAVYQTLVPQHLRFGVRRVSVMGGIGITNHPLTDVPCFWIHPCNSAEAIRNVLTGNKGQVTSIEYLMIWIGLVGSTVGLSLPKEMVTEREH